jgi:molybdate transport system ATP-binding protein
MSVHARFHVPLSHFALDVELSLPASGVTAVIGPSGSGKTSLLRCFAGLTRDPHGELRVGDAVWQDRTRFVPTHRRAIGYVFQDARLFPHLSVRANLEFGMRRVPAAERRVAFERAVELLGVTGLLPRSPRKLSGGERQRVGIARALLTSPQLLLMDEPLASLDLDSRAQISRYLEQLRHELAVPVLYVTHSPLEVVRLAQRIVLLESGSVRAQGPIHELLTRPDLPLSHIDDAGAVLDAKVSAHAPEYHLTSVTIDGGELAISARPLPVGVATRVHVRARDVSLSRVRPERSSISNVLEARVLDVSPDRDPAHRLVRVVVGEGSVLLSRVTYRSVVELQLAPGVALFAQVKSVALVE